jgi:hypothetical protein
MPATEHYQEVVGKTRDFTRDMHHTQQGDPAKAGAAIEAALESASTPLRLALGGDAVEAIRAHAQALLDDLAKWENLSRSTAF